MDAIIFDLDGTLADCRHRLHHVTQYPKNWGLFFAGIPDDVPHMGVAALLTACMKDDAGVGIVLCSGRPEEYRGTTTDWMVKHFGVMPGPLFMRKTGDQRQDAIVKRELLAEIRAAGLNPVLAIDDRPQVIDAWCAEGLPVLAVVADGADSDQVTQWAGETLLTVMVGPSGAGKSRWCETNAHPAAVISSDQIRAELCGDFKDQSKNEQVFAAMSDIARCRLRNGLPVVLDATHLRRKDRMTAAALAPKGTRVRYVVVERPIESRLRDAGWRTAVPGLIEKHDQTFRSQRTDILAGDNLPNVDVVYVAEN